MQTNLEREPKINIVPNYQDTFAKSTPPVVEKERQVTIGECLVPKPDNGDNLYRESYTAIERKTPRMLELEKKKLDGQPLEDALITFRFERRLLNSDIASILGTDVKTVFKWMKLAHIRRLSNTEIGEILQRKNGIKPEEPKKNMTRGAKTQAASAAKATAREEKRLHDEWKEFAIRQMYDKGLTQEQIAPSVGMGLGGLRKYMKRKGIETRRGGRAQRYRQDEESNTRVIKLLGNGNSFGMTPLQREVLEKVYSQLAQTYQEIGLQMNPPISRQRVSELVGIGLRKLGLESKSELPITNDQGVIYERISEEQLPPSQISTNADIWVQKGKRIHFPAILINVLSKLRHFHP